MLGQRTTDRVRSSWRPRLGIRRLPGPVPRRSAEQGRAPVTAGTFPTHRPLFAGLLGAVVLVVVGLTYFPALSLGPIAEGLS